MKKMLTITFALLLLLGTTITRSQSPTTEICTEAELGSYLPSSSDCSVYYQCAGASAPYHWYIASCPSGLHFNENTNTCDIPNKITHWCGCNEK